MPRKEYDPVLPDCPSCNPPETVGTYEHTSKQSYRVQYSHTKRKYVLCCAVCNRLLKTFELEKLGPIC